MNYRNEISKKRKQTIFYADFFPVRNLALHFDEDSETMDDIVELCEQHRILNIEQIFSLFFRIDTRFLKKTTLVDFSHKLKSSLHDDELLKNRDYIFDVDRYL